MEACSYTDHLASELDRLIPLPGVGAGEEPVHREILRKRDMSIRLELATSRKVILGSLYAIVNLVGIAQSPQRTRI